MVVGVPGLTGRSSSEDRDRATGSAPRVTAAGRTSCPVKPERRHRYRFASSVPNISCSNDHADHERGWHIMVERRAVEDGSFLAEGLAGSHAPEVFGTGRVCVEPECNVRLSRYNSTQWCALHESPASTQRPFDTSVRQRGRRRSSPGRRRSSQRQSAA
jgi:hypothetical protein